MSGAGALALAFVGCGAIAVWHLHAILTGDTRIDVTAVIDPDPARARAMAEQAGARPFGSLAPEPLFRITGTKGELTIEGIGRVKLYDGTEPRGTVVGTGNYLQSYEGELTDFAAVVLDGVTPVAGPEQSLGELRAALAKYRSAETDRWESVWEDA